MPADIFHDLFFQVILPAFPFKPNTYNIMLSLLVVFSLMATLPINSMAYGPDDIVTNLVLNTTDNGAISKYSTDFPAMRYGEFMVIEASSQVEFCNGSWYLVNSKGKAVAQVNDEYSAWMEKHGGPASEADVATACSFVDAPSWNNSEPLLDEADVLIRLEKSAAGAQGDEPGLVTRDRASCLAINCRVSSDCWLETVSGLGSCATCTSRRCRWSQFLPNARCIRPVSCY